MDRYIGKRMESITNINNNIKERTRWYQNYTTNQILIFGGDVKERESLYTLIFNWVYTIQNHIDTKVILLRYGSSYMVPQ